MDEPPIINGQQQWAIGERLATGGFGEVFASSRSGETEATYVIKYIPIEPGAERELLYQAMPNVRNIVPLLDFGESKGKYFMVLPRAECSLQDHLSSLNRLPMSEVLDIGYDIGVALVDLAGKIVHRDIKPDNILRLNGSWCLADFGIARYAEASTSPNTRKFAVSPEYAAPERWRHESTTSAADIYSLGATLYRCITGAKPFDGPMIEDFREQHLHAIPPSAQSENPLLNSLVTECLYKSAAARPSPPEFLERISKLAITPSSSFGTLQMAQERVASENAKKQQLLSLAHSEVSRRQMLEEAGNISFLSILGTLTSAIRGAAPSATIQHMHDHWIASLGDWSLSTSLPRTVSPKPWGKEPSPPFDVICCATIGLMDQIDKSKKFSHSLWYCNLASSYAWYELAFSSRVDLRVERPFALPPGPLAGRALAGSLSYYVDLPFRRIAPDALTFAERWSGYLAQVIQS